MQSLDESTIASLEELCQLQCTEEEKRDILHSIQQMLNYASLLNEVDIRDVPCCNFVLRGMVKQGLREDEVLDLLPRETLLSNAPDRTGEMIRVPPVLKNT